jgi:glycosyltransferase involved in cell wall biosynthesis
MTVREREAVLKDEKAHPRLLVFTTLFPHPGRPHSGVFIRERMFRVARILPLTVVAPIPWFPLQGLIRLFRPHFRPSAPYHEVQEGIDVYHPRFFSIPGFCKSWDGLFMALGCYRLVLHLKRQKGFDIIDAHFAFPDGYAATLLGKWCKVPVTITLRGTEVPLSKDPGRRGRIVRALAQADRVFSVAESLKQHAVSLGADGNKIRVVGNGVDSRKFSPVSKAEARAALGLPLDAPILITVGGLVERKGFHRVIECLPELRRQFPDLRYLIVGGAGAEGDWRQQLEDQVARQQLQESVHFLGAMPSDQLRVPLSAADVFVLATRNEGWANVLLEAMACGLPVAATDVGGNREVIRDDRLGIVVPFGDAAALQQALADALRRNWDHESIIAYARKNDWEKRVEVLIKEFEDIFRDRKSATHG